MCLLVFAWNHHPHYRLIFAGNRDEFHERPTAPMRWWAPDEGRGDTPGEGYNDGDASPYRELLAGRDLQAGGTWLGLSRDGRFGVVTNYRDLQAPLPGAPSRGALITRYLAGEFAAKDFVAGLAVEATRYAGFNLLLADSHSMAYASNRAPQFARTLPPGVYGLSNHLLDTPWPKLERTRARFKQLIAGSRPSSEQLFEILTDRVPAEDDHSLSIEEAGTTGGTGTADDEGGGAGLSREWQRLLSAPFIVNERYGTRSSSVVLIDARGRIQAWERRFDRDGRTQGSESYEFDARGSRGRW
jgi:uncharacterized protein with NRDE domain